MIDSVILKVVALWARPFLLAFALFFFFRGHHLPGGGFIAGLLATGAFSLSLIVYGPSQVSRIWSGRLASLIPVGLLCSFVSGLMGPVWQGSPFMTGIWTEFSIPLIGSLGTPLLFEFGVFLVVTGVSGCLLMAFAGKDLTP